MPALYAHYRFGTSVLKQMPEEIRLAVSRFRRLYDVGLHGPDLFFNYSPGISTAVGNLAHACHAQTGQEFFGRVCRMLRLEPSEAGTVYLYGVLAHYCLDSVCHPLIDRLDAEGTVGHTELEAEFDRYLLAADGKRNPHLFDGTRHLHLTDGECETAASFYPPARARHVRRSLTNMRLFSKLLNLQEGKRARKIVSAVTPKLGKAIDGMMMYEAPNLRCYPYDGELLKLYEEAEARYPRMLEQIRKHMSGNVPLGPEFDADFG